MAASAASRAALLGLALLALQQPAAGAISDTSPERGGGSSTSHVPVHHSHHQHNVAGGHRGAHSGSILQDTYGPSKKQQHLSEISSPESDRHTEYSPADVQKVEDAVPSESEEREKDYSSSPHHPSHSNSSCKVCRDREGLRNMNLNVIKEQILNKLGMKQAPNMTGRVRPKIPPLQHLLEAYGMQGDQPERYPQLGPVVTDDEDDYHAKTTMVIAVAQTTKLRHGGGIGTDLDIQHFRFSENSMRNKVADASMFIYVPVMPRPVRVRIYRVVGNATEHQSLTVLLVGSSKLDIQRKADWVEIEARKLIADWFKSPRDNLGVVVKLEDDTQHSIPYSVEALKIHDHSGESKQPFVRVHTVDGRKHRNKRTIGLNCYEDSHETRCCRYSLTVDFEDFGWDWIIAPKKYDANYCSGECPYVFLQKYPHTHIVQQASPAGTAGPCCAPRKMSPISMLYFDNEVNIIFSVLPGMVVDRCGCQ